MATRRSSDLTLILLSAFAVLAAGALIAAGIWVTTARGDRSTGCGLLRLGTADEVRARLEAGGPEYASAGASCDYWLALDAGDVVAYRTSLAGRDCTVRLGGGEFRCGDDPVPPEELEQYPLRVEDIDGVDVVVIDLRPVSRGG